MVKNNHYNIFENLRSAFKVYGHLLDVGCGVKYCNLIDFEKSDFDPLMGLDEKLSDSQSELVNYIWVYNHRNDDKLDLNQLHIQERHKFVAMNLLNYNYEKDKYGLVICTSVLHFFCDEVKYALINMFYNALEKDGLLFIRLNNSLHRDYDNGKKLTKNIVFDTERKAIKYLINNNKFMSYLKKRYIILEDFSGVENGVTTIVIRKFP